MDTSFYAGTICGVLTVLNLASVGLAAARLRRRDRLPAPSGLAEPVTVVRPVCGIEPFLEETLASGFALDHPDYELVLCAEREDDPVVQFVRRLMAARPEIPARLLVGVDRISRNPKLNNCVKGWRAARHDWIVLADSNVLMPPDYVRQLMSSWRADTGLVCSPPLGARPGGFWAEVECAFLNTHQARWQYAVECVGLGFAHGKSMLWRRGVLEANGGVRALAAEAAEDAAATKLVRGAGLRVRLVDAPFEQPLGRRGVRQVWARQARWARLRRATFPAHFAPEILSGAALPLAAGAYAAAAGGHSVSAAVAALLALWYGAEAALARGMGWHLSWRLPVACLVRDCLIPAIWVWAWTGGKAVWHGKAMDLRSAGAGRPPPPDPDGPAAPPHTAAAAASATATAAVRCRDRASTMAGDRPARRDHPQRPEGAKQAQQADLGNNAAE
jgi:ceramide glucosyltransferase